MDKAQATTPAGHEQETKYLVYSYIVCASFWLFVGTAYGLLAAVKLYWPEAFETPLLSFGRIRPIHTNIVLFGWSSMALTGIALYVISRTSKVPLHCIGMAQAGLILWNLALILTVVTLSYGISRGPQEYREVLTIIMDVYVAGLLCNLYTAYSTVARRAVAEIYVSNWYVLGAFCWLTIIVVIAYTPFYQSGMGNIVIQGYFMHNSVGMWFTPLVLGITYYALPRMLGKPIYSYALGVLAFWTAILFYTLLGAHHFVFSPVSWWLQTIAIVFSVGMLIPVWAGFMNFFLTARGSWHKVRRNYALIFLITGIWGYALSSSQGTIEAFRSVNIYWHFTNFTVGHSHMAMYGFVAFGIWGAIYGLVPPLMGRGPSENAIKLHFWLAFLGGSLYVIAISIAGILQGASWVAEESFIASVEAAAPMWLWRSIGGAMMVLSHIVFIVNVWAMRPVKKPCTTYEQVLA